MLRSSFLTVLTAVVLWFAGSSELQAQRTLETRDGGSHRSSLLAKKRLSNFVDRLDLSAEQEQQIRNIETAAEAALKTLNQQLQEARLELISLLGSGASDEQLRQQHQQLTLLNSKLLDARFELFLATKRVLTPEQQGLWADILERKTDGGFR